MVKRLKLHGVIVCLLAAPLWLPAQDTLQTQSYPQLLRAIVENTRHALYLTPFDSLFPEATAELNGHLAVLEQAAATMQTSAGVDQPGIATTLRSSQSDFVFRQDGPQGDLEASLQYVKAVSNGQLGRLLDEAVGPGQTDRLLQPVNDLQVQQTRASLEQSMERLRHFEVKYGPNSARLNLLEAAVNHFLLRGIPAFGVDENGAPGPLELIMAYNTAYLNYDKNANSSNDFLLLSAAELGLRHYFFNKGWGKGNYLKPAYVSVGALLASEKSGFLRNPFDGGAQWGAFVSWGEFKLAYTFGDDNRLLLSKQFQVLPFLF